jgi:transposase
LKETPTAQVWIELSAEPGRPLICSACGRAVSQVHDCRLREIRDLPILEAQSHLPLFPRRVLCPHCGPKLEPLPWRDRYAHVTKPLAENVARRSELLPIRHVAQYYGVHWETVKQIHKQYLQRKLVGQLL